MRAMRERGFLAAVSLVLTLTLVGVGCGEEAFDIVAGETGTTGADAAKGDEAKWSGRQVEVLLTEPYCDVCQPADKSLLKPTSPIVARLIGLIDDARTHIEIAQFTFSRTDIEAAVLRAHERGVAVRVAMNAAQEQQGVVANRLKDAGVPVGFVAGKSNGQYAGLMHAKFMLVDGQSLVFGSNNWSSTGTSINEENNVIVHAGPTDSLLGAFACAFEAVWRSDAEGAAACSTGEVWFTPSSGPIAMLRDNIRAAERSVDVLMHHLLFDTLLKELAKAAEAGLAVRIIINEADRAEAEGKYWDRIRAAGGQVRFKRGNPDLYQLMHHKLAIIDGRVLLDGSGNWSGSAFFNNYEFYTRIGTPSVVEPFVALYERLWMWSLGQDALERGLTAAEQHAERTQVFFGNLHAHHESEGVDRHLDDGILERVDDDGQPVDVHEHVPHGDGARYAYEYARDQGGLDFLALTPHVTADDANQAPDVPNMSVDGYHHIVMLAELVTDGSDGMFVALPGMEWNTNSAGNHVTVVGTRELAKVATGRFDHLYGGFLPQRREAGERPLIGFNHPRTFRVHTDTLSGNWDQVFGHSLADIPKTGQRKVKFNDYGLDDYPPLRDVWGGWIAGAALPDEALVAETLQSVWAAASPYLRFMEVTVARGKEIRHEQGQNPSLSEQEDGTVERFTKVHSDWDYYLLNGFRLAPVAPHDNHYANWGTGHSSRTALLAPALTEDALLDALDARLAYASEDQNLEIRLYAEDRVPMGSELGTLSPKVALSVLLADPDYSGGYEVTAWVGTVGGEVVERALDTLASGGDWTRLEVPVPTAPGVHFLYLEVYEPSADRMAWTAPVWVRRPAAP